MGVFISYSHEDKLFAETVAQALRENTIHVWVDSWQMNAGDSIQQRITSAIRGSSVILFFISNNFLQSKWCMRELEICLEYKAKDSEVTIVPLLLDSSPLPQELIDISGIKFKGNVGNFVNQITNSLRRFTDIDLNRVKNETYHTDYAIDYQLLHRRLMINIVTAESSPAINYIITSQWEVQCPPIYGDEYRAKSIYDREYEVVDKILTEIHTNLIDQDRKLRLIDGKADQCTIWTNNLKNERGVEANVTCRRIGINNGYDQEYSLLGVLSSVIGKRDDLCKRL